MHESNHRRVFTKVYDYVCIFEYKKRLQKNIDQAQGFCHYGDGKRDFALGYDRVVVEIGLDHLNQAETSIDHGANAENSRAYAHIKLARAIFVVVCEVEFG